MPQGNRGSSTPALLVGATAVIWPEQDLYDGRHLSARMILQFKSGIGFATFDFGLAADFRHDLIIVSQNELAVQAFSTVLASQNCFIYRKCCNK